MIFSEGKVRILSVCDDEGLRLSRELLLRNSGYETESATSRDLLEGSYVRTFTIAMICASIEPTSVGPLTERLIRFHPEIQILDIGDLQGKSEFFSEFLLSASPHLLLKAVNEMREKTRKSPRSEVREHTRRFQRSAER